jgi:hypothetical protein
MRIWRATSCFVSLALSSAIVAQESATDSSLAEARAILVGFDRAWNEGDLDAIVAGVAPTFGCEFYGGIGAEQFAQTLRILKERLGDSNCTTHVEALVRHGEVIQARVCREFFAGGAVHGAATPREVQYHVVYLRPLDTKLQLVALEEYDPETTALYDGNRFVDPVAGLAFALPDGMFVVAEPRLDGVVRFVLRSDDLHGQIRVSLDLLADPFKLEPAFDHDLREWQSFSSDVYVAWRKPAKLGGYPALRAEGTYRGGACSLQPKDEAELLPRAFTRVYCQPDEKVLLAVHLDADARIAKRLAPHLETLLASVQFESDGAKSYGASLAARLGYGPIEAGTFECADSRCEIVAPLGYSLERIPSPGCFALRLAAPKDAATVTIEAMALLEPECDPGLIAEFDDQVYLDRNEERAQTDARLEHARVTIGTLSGVRVERIEGRTPRERQTRVAFYVVSGDYLLVVDSIARDAVSARLALDAVVRGITIAK